jgi:hypothetical protein
MSRRVSTALLATIGLTALLAAVVHAATAPATANSVGLQQTIGTVSAVDADARRISVITGRGHALRVMVFLAGTDCRIELGGAFAPLMNLRRGQIVDVRYRGATEPYTAESIATVPASDVGGQK